VKRTLALLVVLAQVGVLAFMAGQREWVARTGRTVTLRTAPVDPNDPMRGEYVRLSYDISQVPRSLCRDGVLAYFDVKANGKNFRDQRVFAVLEADGSGPSRLVALTDRQPAEGTYLRGRVDFVNAFQGSGSVRVRYGIEALFVEEGQAKAFADARGGPMTGVPLDMDVSVSPGGMAVLKGHHWEALGLIVAVDRPARPLIRNPQPGPRPGAQGASLELKNVSGAPVAILAQAFRLVGNAQHGTGRFRWVGEGRAPKAVDPADVRLLRPGESLRIPVDFMDPQWFVTDSAKPAESASPVSLSTLANAWDASFRIAYAPPDAAACAGLPHADRIWHGEILSAAFSAGSY
jgi:uncharacterized membrane-anchored protein